MYFSGILAAASLITGVVATQDGISVPTWSGPVVGHLAPEVREFLGIPYARPPTGLLRFAPPVRVTPWIRPFNASTFGASCHYTRFTADLGDSPISLPDPSRVDEDCLNLNIWAPSGAKGADVMIWTYGGGFVLGSSETPIYNGANIVRNNKNVIVVSFNYRLSVFGFPASNALPDKEKNPGLRDVRFAVEWVRDNIAAFGGDPRKITLFGESAGGAAVDSYLYTHTRDPIIRGAILQSGTINIATDALLGEVTPGATFDALATALGCTSTTSVGKLACVRLAPASRLVTLINTTPNLTFTPVADNGTVFSDISRRLSSGDFARVPVLVGSNDQEIPGTTPEAIIGTRLAFTCPAARSALGHSQYVPTWQYRYFGNFPSQPGVPPAGPFHGSEITQVFGTYYDPIATEQQRKSSKYIQGAWIAFVRDPVRGLEGYKEGWPRFDRSGQTLVRLAWENKDEASFVNPDLYQAGCY
ncbi:alpha/beta-hydrolase [Ascodesmis nigricans]|uniref:Carboxylic ester hydrolase n=1 Tax=Ascodesmis nigricans TaxID=341454 RepID=A0A4V3SIB2_9PEZI|nr:alpha/beta-hydrolase [Ascodesmis nigricans]